MKGYKILLAIILLCNSARAQDTWEVTNVRAIPALNSTITLVLTAKAYGIMSPNSFDMVYYKTYMQADTFVLRPYYYKPVAGVGFPGDATIIDSISIPGIQSGANYICITPYEITDPDTASYPTTPNPPYHCMTMQEALSIPYTSAANTPIIYPNPASTHITLGKDVVAAYLYSSDGKLLMHSTQRYISLAHLPAGMYMIRLQTNTITITKKLLKE